MQIKSILVTGDDGYNALGVRVLIKLLKDKYDLVVSATEEQQSGVGGKITLRNEGMKWGEAEVDGFKVFWVNGTPVDAVEFAQDYFQKEFDLVISGINWGPNLSRAIISSGTVSAAVRALGNKLCKHALALSWNAPAQHWTMNHVMENDYREYLNYPGQAAAKIIDLCVKNDFYKVRFININFPKEKTEEYRFTRLCEDTKEVYAHPNIIDIKNKTFNYPSGYAKERIFDEKIDVGAINKGYISISLIEEVFRSKNVTR